jgi:hypothetical protein
LEPRHIVAGERRKTGDAQRKEQSNNNPSRRKAPQPPVRERPPAPNPRRDARTTKLTRTWRGLDTDVLAHWGGFESIRLLGLANLIFFTQCAAKNIQLILSKTPLE